MENKLISSEKKKFTYDRDEGTIYLIEDPSISLKILGFLPEQGFVWVLGYRGRKIGLTTLDQDGTEYFPETAEDGSKIRIIADIGVYVSRGSRRPPLAPSFYFRNRQELKETLGVIQKVFSVLPDDNKFEKGTGSGKLRFSDGMLERIENGAYIR